MYVLIAYLPEYVNYTTGENISSAYRAYHSLSEDDLLFYWTQILDYNMTKSSSSGREYYVQVFNNSTLIWDEIEEQGEIDYDVPLYKKMINYYNRMYLGVI